MATAYDEVPYRSYPYARTHPDRLCTIARLFGLHAAPPTKCRVLELGCADGGNLLAMADLLPGSEFVGVDASERQIADGRELLESSGLSNAELRHADILDVDEAWGDFDYIVAHGVYSWVPAAVQRKILEIVRDHLRPRGVGYISYNVYPGWHMRELVRRMMIYHSAQFEDPRQRLQQAQALVDFLARHAPKSGDPYGALLERELAVWKRTGSDYVFHEHLEDINEPVYFHEFAQRIADHELQYLGETDAHTMLVGGYEPKVRETLERICTDIVQMEQYMDFVRNRQFRATLVCHRSVELERHVTPEAIEHCYVGFEANLEDTPVDVVPGVSHEFTTRAGVSITTDRSLTKAAFAILRRTFPRVLTLDELFKSAAGLLAEASIGVEAKQRRDLATDIIAAYLGAGGVELRTWRPPIARAPGTHPRASALTRIQAERLPFVTSLRHTRLDLDRAHRAILALLDGTRDAAALGDRLADLVQAGTLDLSLDARPLDDPAQRRAALVAVLDNTLPRLAAMGLLLED